MPKIDTTLPPEVQLEKYNRLIEQRRAAAKNWILKNREKHAELTRAYYHRNLELSRERARNRYRAKRDSRKVEGSCSPSSPSSPVGFPFDPACA
jgi:hypothetical protein